MWLELFLSNGKVKTSNVLEINTKSLDHPEPIDSEYYIINFLNSLQLLSVVG